MGRLGLLALLVAAACSRTSYIATTAEDGVALWKSEAVANPCMRDFLNNLHDPAAVERPESCEDTTFGNLPQGTVVEVLTPAAQCGDIFTRVRVTTGALRNTVGCIAPHALAAEAPK